MPFDEALNPYVAKVREHPLISKEAVSIFDLFKEKKSIVDLGCGNGHFLQERLLRELDLWGLGVERRFKRSFKTAEKLEKTRARVAQMDVLQFLQSSPDSYWDEVWLQFPDPWPKLRHEKNRMVSQTFIAEIHRIVKPGGRFCFRSDCRAYWEFLQMENIRTNRFPVEKSQKGNLFEDMPKTLYQKKFERLGIGIYSLEWRRLK